MFKHILLMHNTARNLFKVYTMADWINAIMFGVALIAFTLGFSSIIMGFMTAKAGAEGMQEKIEYGFFGVTGIVLCALMAYGLA